MEQFVIRTTGGPEPGLYFSDDSVTGWPLPEMLVAPGGHYQKISESQMPAPDGAAAQTSVRGAEYAWVPDVVGLQADQSSTIIIDSDDERPDQDQMGLTPPRIVDSADDDDGKDWVVGQEA